MLAIISPKEKENFPPPEAHFAYKLLVNDHLHFLKLQSKCEIFNWKLVCIFFLLIFGTFVLQSKGIISNQLVAITSVGCGYLVMYVQNLRMDLEYVHCTVPCPQMCLPALFASRIYSLAREKSKGFKRLDFGESEERKREYVFMCLNFFYKDFKFTFFKKVQ